MFLLAGIEHLLQALLTLLGCRITLNHLRLDLYGLGSRSWLFTKMNPAIGIGPAIDFAIAC